MDKKYELTDEVCVFKNHKLHRIKALKNFGNVKKGDLGGWIETEKNLSRKGNCWVYDNAKVFGNARIHGSAKICREAQVFGYANVFDFAKVSDNAFVFDSAAIFDEASIYDCAKICGSATICENGCVLQNAKVSKHAVICGDAVIKGNAIVKGHVTIKEDVFITGDARIRKCYDYIVFKNWWASGKSFVWTRSNDMWSDGWFYGTSKELLEKAYKNSESNGIEYERIIKYVESIKNK